MGCPLIPDSISVLYVAICYDKFLECIVEWDGVPKVEHPVVSSVVYPGRHHHTHKTVKVLKNWFAAQLTYWCSSCAQSRGCHWSTAHQEWLLKEWCYGSGSSGTSLCGCASLWALTNVDQCHSLLPSSRKESGHCWATILNGGENFWSARKMYLGVWTKSKLFNLCRMLHHWVYPPLMLLEIDVHLYGRHAIYKGPRQNPSHV